VAIAENELLSELTEIWGTDALLLEEELVGELPLLPHAATTRAAPPATAVSPTLLGNEYNETTSLIGGTCQDIYLWQVRMALTAVQNLYVQTLGRHA
jgi:hypothetical protein